MTFFGHIAKQRDQGAKVNCKLYDVTNWEINNSNTHIAENHNSKGNQKIKLDHIVRYNMRNIFLEKSYTKYCGKASPRNFSKNLKWSMSQQFEVLYALFLLYV